MRPRNTRKRRQAGKQTRKAKHSSPGHDFYFHINGTWLQKAKIPPTKSAYGVSEEIEKQIELKTEVLLKDCIALSKKEGKSPTSLQSLEVCLGTLAQSVISADTQKDSLHTLQQVLLSIQSLATREEVAVVMGEFVKYRIHGLFHIYGQYENKNATHYTYTIGVGGLGLPDPTYYFKKSLHRNVYLKSYKHMLQKLGRLVQIPQLSCVVDVERILAGVLLRTENDTTEHERTGSELEKEFPHFPFAIVFETMGLENWRPRKFFIESLRWLHTLNKLYNHLGLDYWKLLLSLEFLLFAIPWLPPSYSNVAFQFYKKQLRGQQEKLSREKQAIYVVQQYTTNFFSKLYVEKIVDPDVKPQVTLMVKEFLRVAENRLSTVEWLEPSTRKKAQEKIKKMRYSVGYPDSFDHYSYPKLKEDNLLFNLLTLGEWTTNYEIKKLGQPLSQRRDWDDGVSAVNAYYYSQANEIMIPSGILHDPFYDRKRSLAWNYGGIGCTICHELTHAFDKEGKEYDPNGFQKHWWTPSDNRNYNKQTKQLIELYEKQKIYPYPVSGKKTLSENIADIGGMGIALDVLKEKLDSLSLTQEQRKKAYRDFFTSYAISWRMKDKQKKRLQALIMDKHAPPTLRVNLVVSQFQEWYDAFDIKSEDRLYIPPEKRINLF